MYLLDLAHAYLSRIIDCLSPLLVHHDKIVLNCLSIPQEMGQLQDSVFGCVGALCQEHLYFPAALGSPLVPPQKQHSVCLFLFIFLTRQVLLQELSLHQGPLFSTPNIFLCQSKSLAYHVNLNCPFKSLLPLPSCKLPYYSECVAFFLSIVLGT